MPPVPPGDVATRPGGFWRRFGAFLIDAIIVGFFLVPAIVVLEIGPREDALCETFDGGIERCEVPTEDTEELALILLLGAQVANLGYYALLEGKKGQTIGKQILGLRVVDARHGGPIGPWRAQGRYLARILSTIPLGLGYFWSLWDSRRQTWHDKIVKAVVVRTRP